MHWNFKHLPSIYFNSRPINEDFLEYSAKDVEDLVEVHYKVEEKTVKLLSMILSGNEREEKARFIANYLAYKISKGYVQNGCNN